MARRATASVARQAAAIGWAAPQVVLHRLTRMAQAGAMPSARDRREFERMTTEKVAAFYESWGAMTQAAWRIQQAMWLAPLRTFWWTPWNVRPFDPARQVRALQRAGAQILGAGMVPVRKRATANARRLGRTRRSKHR